LREELRIKDARMTQVCPQRRPHYPPAERMAILERQVGGHDQAVTLVGRGDHVEQQLRARLAGRYVTELIQDEQVQLGKLLPEPQELPLFLGLQEQGDQLGHSEEADSLASAAGGDAEARRQMRFSRTARTDQENVSPLVEVISLDELQHERLVDAGAGREVELVECLVGREAGGLQSSLGRLTLPLDQFQFGQLQQKAEVIDVVADSASVAKHAKVRLGGGTNTFSVEGDVARHLFYYGKEGDDTVSILANARVAQHAKINLGDGNNTFTLEGRVDRNLMLTAGSGLDTIDILSSARIAKDAKLTLGDGDNVTTFEGEVHRSLKVSTGAGLDKLAIASGAKVSRDAKLKLGVGDDSVSHAGKVGRNMNVDGGDGTDTYADLGGKAKSLKLNSIEVLA